jgi:thiosulfate reductase cytochrome b subunit
MTQTLLPKDVDAPIKIITKHHLLVRIAHWTNIPTSLGLVLSGLSIYWASPVIKIPTKDGNKDIFEIIGAIAIKYLPGQTDSARNWFYNHFALGSGNLAFALNIHWFCAYLLMTVAAVYLIGTIWSGSYRALLPRPTDIADGFKMIIYYLKVLPAWAFKVQNPHPIVTTKYNALQRAAYFSVSIGTILSILTGGLFTNHLSLGLYNLYSAAMT